MKRKCVIIRSSDVINRHICVDVDNYADIKEVIYQSEKFQEKFDYISKRILENQNMYYEGFERIYNKNGIKISEMRLFPGKENSRIYCKEIQFGNKHFCIIMCVAIQKKKSQKIGRKLKQIIDSIKDYEYELQY